MTAPLHVAIGVLAGVTGGPASYGRHLVRALAERRDDVRVSVVTDRPDAFDEAGCEIVPLPMRGGIDRLRWQYLALPRALRRLRPDVYHDTKNALPFPLPVPAVVTVHDLAYRVVPESFGWLSRAFLTRATTDAVRRARVVVVPSQATADDVARFHPRAAAKLRVVPHGIDPAPHLAAENVAAVRSRLRLPEHYVLHVGTVQARKNVDLLVRAVRSLRARHPHRLVVVGRRGWLAERTIAEIERDDTAMWLGEIAASDLAAVYAAADAFVSPSAYEGFGFTVGDALAAGIPTVISGVSSLPEVCGDAAVRLARIDEQAIAEALDGLLADPERRLELSARGRERAAGFSWQRAAEGHVAAYRSALGRV
jgi:glycosyltransferase involved in cell wall biosynthesis